MEMDREEGELSDEEELEDVSDNSSLSMIPIPYIMTGKSLSSNRTPFRELSLTSVSDESEDREPVYRYDEIRHYQRKKYQIDDKRHNGKKRIRKICERRVVRRKSSVPRKYSSLSSSSDESDSYKQDKKLLKQLRDAVSINRSQNLPNCSLRTRIKRMIQTDFQSSKNNTDEDSELEALREQALHSKSKKDPNLDSAESNQAPNVTDEDLIELRLIALQSAVLKKHQNRRKQKEEQEKQNKEVNSNIPVVENVETTVQLEQENHKDVENSEEKQENIDEDEDILRAMLLTSISKKISSKKNNKQVNTQNISLKKVIPVKKTNEYKTTIHPMPVNRFIINVNSDSDSDSDCDQTIKADTEKEKDLFDKSLSLFLQQARAKSDVQRNSDISHLPRSQQLEYKRLKRKLQLLTNRVAPVAKTFFVKEPRKLINHNIKLNIARNNTVFKEKQMNKKVDRLQMKGKYEELTSLMTRVSDAREARDRAQAEVKRLINDLRIARMELTSTHQNYTVLVQQLVKEKAGIDKRKIFNCSLDENEIKEIHPAVCTSTPNKKQTSDIQCEMSISENDISKKNEDEMADIQDIPVITTENDNKDIDKQEDKNEFSILQYSSPLDHIQLNTDRNPNPLSVLCPYDLLGVCRDPDCKYQHCGNALTNC